jgi:excisionase family DNA binding protein
MRTAPADDGEGRRHPFVDADVIAQDLGVHRATIYRWAAAGSVPSIRVGGTVRFDRQAVHAALRGADMDMREKARLTREHFRARSEDTWVAELSTGVVVIAHPGQPLDILEDAGRLRVEFGILPGTRICRLSESIEAVPDDDLDIDSAE